MRPGYGLQTTDSSVEAASRVMGFEYDKLLAAADAVFGEEGTAPLHDLRVGIRKFRAASRYFAPWLEATNIEYIDQCFADLADVLSPARDRDAWLEYLISSSINKQLKGNKRFQNYLDTLSEERLRLLPEVRDTLSEKFDYGFRQAVADLLDNQLKQIKENDNSPRYAEFGCRRLGKYYQKVIQIDCVSANDAAGLIHVFRKKCRRGRYWAEFTIPAGKTVAKQLAKYFKSLATAVGTARDMQLHLEQWRQSDIDLPGKFLRWQQTVEQDAWQEAKHSWKKLTSETMQKKVKAALVLRGKA